MSIKDQINAASSLELEIMIAEANGAIKNIAWAKDNLKDSSFTLEKLEEMDTLNNIVIRAASERLACLCN